MTLVVLGASKKDLRSAVSGYYLSVDELIMIANPDSRWGGYGTIANRCLDQMLGDVLGFIHADTALSQEVCDNLEKAALEGAIAGVVGPKQIGNIWSREIDIPTQVLTLDSCAWFVSRQTIQKFNLRFDVEMFDSFHCCVEDFCLQGSTQGVPILVVPGWALHPFPLDKDTKHWEPTIHKFYKDRLAEKWKYVAGVNFGTT